MRAAGNNSTRIGIPPKGGLSGEMERGPVPAVKARRRRVRMAASFVIKCGSGEAPGGQPLLTAVLPLSTVMAILMVTYSHLNKPGLPRFGPPLFRFAAKDDGLGFVALPTIQ